MKIFIDFLVHISKVASRLNDVTLTSIIYQENVFIVINLHARQISVYAASNTWTLRQYLLNSNNNSKRVATLLGLINECGRYIW